MPVRRLIKRGAPVFIRSGTIRTTKPRELASIFMSHLAREPYVVTVDGGRTVMTFDAVENRPANSLRLEVEMDRLVLTVSADTPESLAGGVDATDSLLARLATAPELTPIEWHWDPSGEDTPRY